MRRLLVGLALSTCLALNAGGSEARKASALGTHTTARGPFVLVSLGSLGTVTWTCEGRTGRYALGFRLAGRWATTSVTLRVSGRGQRQVTVQPGDRVTFPFLAEDVQRLVIAQRTGARTIRAEVAATFDPGASYAFCWAYLPPTLDVRMRQVG